MGRKVYGSDVSWEQFERVRPLLEGVRKRTKPRTVDLYDVFCGALYLLKTGCQWRMLPDGFPKWRTVHSYFAKWSEPGPDGTSVLEQVQKKSVGEDAVTTAEVTDRNGALAALDRCADSLKHITSVLADGGYSGKPFADAVRDKLGAGVQIAKRSQLHTFAVMPQQWVVERSFAWLEKCRRLWKNCERKLNTSLQMIHLAFLVLLLRRS